MILWRTSGTCEKNSIYSGLLSRFHGYGGVHVMVSKQNSSEIWFNLDMSRDMRNPVFGVSDRARSKHPACVTTESS